MTRRPQPETTLDRRTATAILLEGRDDVLVVPGLGSATWDCAALGDNPTPFLALGRDGQRVDDRGSASRWRSPRAACWC